jgi:hypothetical protein
MLTSYIVCYAIMMPLISWLAGRLGIKYVFASFTVASALCAAATSIRELVPYKGWRGPG